MKFSLTSRAASKGFQFTGNYWAKLEASESCRRNVENQVGGLTELWRGVGVWPGKDYVVFIVRMSKNSTKKSSKNSEVI